MPQRKKSDNKQIDKKRRQRCRQRQLAEELARYVKAMAPASGEFARETSDHVAEVLLRETEW